jgi:hypothetical protein
MAILKTNELPQPVSQVLYYFASIYLSYRPGIILINSHVWCALLSIFASSCGSSFANTLLSLAYSAGSILIYTLNFRSPFLQEAFPA